MDKIVVQRGGKTELEHEIQKESVSIGRDPSSDIVLADPSVSRRHARIERKGPRSYRIVDLESGNGIVHDGKRVEALDLFPGCEVEIGSCTLRFASDAPLPMLVLIAGGPRRVFPLTSDETLLGRSPEAAVPVPDPLVSSRHLQILRRGDVFAVKDLESENGTRVNGVRVSSKELQQGDQIQVGGFTFYFARDGAIPEVESIKILQPAQTPARSPASSPTPFHPFPAFPHSLQGSPAPVSPEAAPAPPKGAAAAASDAKAGGRHTGRGRLMLLGGAAAFFLLFVIVIALLVRSPDQAAEREFQEVFQNDLSEDARARIDEYLSRAKEYESTGNLSLALEQYRKVLVLDATHHQALAESARLEETLRTAEAERASEERAARERSAKVAELADRATNLLSERKFDEARKVLEEARDLSPESDVLTQKLVESYVAEGDLYRSSNAGRARGAYQQALSLDPSSAAAKRGLGAMEQQSRASRDREKRIAELNEKGLAELQREQFREAYQSFSEVLKLDPNQARAREFRDQAAQLLERQVRPMYEEGVRLYNAGELAAAMAQFQKVLAQNPDHADTKAFLQKASEKVRAQAVDLYKRAYIYEGLGRLREALDLYKQCLALLPDPKEEYHQKAAARIAELNRKL